MLISSWSVAVPIHLEDICPCWTGTPLPAVTVTWDLSLLLSILSRGDTNHNLIATNTFATRYRHSKGREEHNFIGRLSVCRERNTVKRTGRKLIFISGVQRRKSPRKDQRKKAREEGKRESMERYEKNERRKRKYGKL